MPPNNHFNWALMEEVQIEDPAIIDARYNRVGGLNPKQPEGIKIRLMEEAIRQLQENDSQRALETIERVRQEILNTLKPQT